ncbi:MAG: hypothetical protein ACLPM3_05980 [Terracidiphilus sp.]
MIYVYGDDGSDAKQERVVAVSALAGSEEHWQQLEAKWIPRCGGIPFHAKDCESDQGDYRSIPHENNKAMYRDLVSILANSGIGGIAIAIDISAQFQTFPDSAALSYYRAFVEVLQRTAALAERVGHIAKLTCDISSQNEFNAGYLYNVMREGDAKFRDWLYPEISFVSAKYSARVQTGDLLAYEGWKALDHTVGPVKRARKSWEALRSSGFETFSYSKEWFADLRKHIESGDLTQRVGFTPQDYGNWLKETGRQHNITNMFTFMDRMRVRDEQGKSE